jgi:hypothetical protein
MLKTMPPALTRACDGVVDGACGFCKSKKPSLI